MSHKAGNSQSRCWDQSSNAEMVIQWRVKTHTATCHAEWVKNVLIYSVNQESDRKQEMNRKQEMVRGNAVLDFCEITTHFQQCCWLDSFYSTQQWHKGVNKPHNTKVHDTTIPYCTHYHIVHTTIIQYCSHYHATTISGSRMWPVWTDVVRCGPLW